MKFQTFYVEELEPSTDFDAIFKLNFCPYKVLALNLFHFQSFSILNFIKNSKRNCDIQSQLWILDCHWKQFSILFWIWLEFIFKGELTAVCNKIGFRQNTQPLIGASLVGHPLLVKNQFFALITFSILNCTSNF